MLFLTLLFPVSNHNLAITKEKKNTNKDWGTKAILYSHRLKKLLLVDILKRKKYHSRTSNYSVPTSCFTAPSSTDWEVNTPY